MRYTTKKILSPEIIDRLKHELGVDSDAALAKVLKVPQTTVSGWRTRGTIPVHRLEWLVETLGISVPWLLTGKEVGSPADKRLVVAEAHAQYGSSPAVQRLTEDFLHYVNDASAEDRETIRRLLKGLRASKEVRDHLVGQLKLIERLVEQEKPREDEAADPPSRAKAS